MPENRLTVDRNRWGLFNPESRELISIFKGKTWPVFDSRGEGACSARRIDRRRYFEKLKAKPPNGNSRRVITASCLAFFFPPSFPSLSPFFSFSLFATANNQATFPASSFDATFVRFSAASRRRLPPRSFSFPSLIILYGQRNTADFAAKCPAI